MTSDLKFFDRAILMRKKHFGLFGQANHPSSAGWEDEGKEDPKKKRKCTRKHKPDYNESK